MRKLFGVYLLMLLFAYTQVQIQWQYTTKKIDKATFELHLTARLQEGWHIYTQKQPEDGIATPTKIAFTKNPLVLLKGDVKEVGNKQKYKDPSLGIEQYQYSNKVDFVQVIKLKGTSTKLRTSAAGSVTSQLCTNEKCLPPASTSFNMASEGQR